MISLYCLNFQWLHINFINRKKLLFLKKSCASLLLGKEFQSINRPVEMWKEGSLGWRGHHTSRILSFRFYFTILFVFFCTFKPCQHFPLEGKVGKPQCSSILYSFCLLISYSFSLGFLASWSGSLISYYVITFMVLTWLLVGLELSHWWPYLDHDQEKGKRGMLTF